MQWACLPPDLIISVADRLSVADFARFRAVCASWALAVKDFRPDALSCFPWLYPIKPHLLSHLPVDDRDVGLPFFSVLEDRCYRLPLVDNMICTTPAGGISVNLHHRDGWYVFLPDGHHVPQFVNPLSGTRLPLPSVRTLPRYHKSNVGYVFIPRPAHNVIFAFYRDMLSLPRIPPLPGIPFRTFLAFARPGDDRWTCISDTRVRLYADVVYLQGKFYALCSSGNLLAFDITGTNSILLAQNKYDYVSDPFSREWPSRVMFLASSPSGDLLHVRGGTVNDFLVMKFDANLDGWVQIMNLGGSCMFLDESQAMLVSQQDVPAGARRNAIYFAGSAVGDGIHLPTSHLDYEKKADALQMFESLSSGMQWQTLNVSLSLKNFDPIAAYFGLGLPLSESSFSY